ncbi:MAG: HU family DNA-binding protein [Microcoleus vaginatus WJT46-NPBG5]|jgi:nucleoid DNA-binding protein|nr:HU family DNA-binding protein [Microcoleus vaginatus WJT46-NPBG5]
MSQSLFEYLEQSTGYTQPVVSSILNGFSNFVELSLRQGSEVRVENFGSFAYKDIPERQARNPRTGEPVIVPPKRKPTFKFSKNFAQKIVNSFEESPPQNDEPVTSLEAQSPATPPPIPANLIAQSKPTWFMGKPDGTINQISESEMTAVSPDTPIWSEKTGWKLARDIPEFKF